MEQTRANQELSLPFITYPKDEEELRKSIWVGSNCRHEYGLKFIQITNQNRCAYCDRPLTDDYYAWVTMVLDHVVPQSVCDALGIKPEWCWSLANAVLACAACNGFDNRYKLSSKLQIATFQEFLNLRDDIFIKRKERIQKKHEEEKEFYEKKFSHALV
jgi:DNA-directed RNA polymerase subunit N (RpoN/RPB10)